jgi:hypothetical protein
MKVFDRVLEVTGIDRNVNAAALLRFQIKLEKGNEGIYLYVPVAEDTARSFRIGDLLKVSVEKVSE